MTWVLWAFFRAKRALKKARTPEKMLYQWDDGTMTLIERSDLGLALDADAKDAAQGMTLGRDLVFGPLRTSQLRAIIAIAQEYETIDLALVVIAAHANWGQDMREDDEAEG